MFKAPAVAEPLRESKQKKKQKTQKTVHYFLSNLGQSKREKAGSGCNVRPLMMSMGVDT